MFEQPGCDLLKFHAVLIRVCILSSEPFFRDQGYSFSLVTDDRLKYAVWGHRLLHVGKVLVILSHN